MFFLQPCMLKNIGNMGRGTARPDGPIDPSLMQLRRDRAFAEELAKEKEQQKKDCASAQKLHAECEQAQGVKRARTATKEGEPKLKIGIPICPMNVSVATLCLYASLDPKNKPSSSLEDVLHHYGRKLADYKMYRDESKKLCKRKA